MPGVYNQLIPIEKKQGIKKCVDFRFKFNPPHLRNLTEDFYMASPSEDR